AQIVGIVAVFSVASHGVSIQTLQAVIAALFLSISIFFLDDAHDRESDRIVHPQRPIPKRLITSRQAYALSGILLVAGVLFASTLRLYQFAIYIVSIATAIAIVFFNIKSILRASLTAFLIWSVFPFAAFPGLKSVLFGLIMALPHVGGSIAKDFIHSRGDMVQGLEPPPDWSKYLASTAFFLCGAIVWLPTILSLVTWLYIPPIILADVSCVLLGFMTLKGRYKKVYVYGGIAMCSSLAAFLLGGM
ncbi:MAG: UbiA family prenyltransferase, partial [Candidatus Bathyarchaeota archaeon]